MHVTIGKKSLLIVYIAPGFAAATTLILESWPTQANMAPFAENETSCTQPPEGTLKISKVSKVFFGKLLLKHEKYLYQIQLNMNTFHTVYLRG